MNIQEFKDAFLAGTGLKELCIKYNFAYEDVLRKAKLENWAKAPVPTQAVLIPDSVKALSPIEQGHLYQKGMSEILSALPGHLQTMQIEDILESAQKIETIDKVARRNFGLDKEVTGGPTLNINILAQGALAFLQDNLPIEEKVIDI